MQQSRFCRIEDWTLLAWCILRHGQNPNQIVFSSGHHQSIPGRS